MDSKSGLGAAGDREMRAFKFSLLTVLAWFLRSLADFNRSRAECALMHDTCVFKEPRSDRAHKRREILSHTSVFYLARRI